MTRTSDQWADQNGRLWDTAHGHPITIGHDREPQAPHTEFAGRLTTPEQVERFALAGSATLTLVSVRTGKRYTYKVSKPNDFTEDRAIWFVSVLKGENNESDFGYIGQIRPPRGNRTAPPEYQRGAKCWKDWYAASHGFAWFWAKVIVGGQMPAGIEVWHEGRCGRCNRKLTVPESIESGFGPECIQHV